MKSTKGVPIFLKEPETKPRHSVGDSDLLPRIFKHPELIQRLKKGENIHKSSLVSIINHMHFSDRHLFLHFKHVAYDETLIVKALPEPCLGRELTCRWVAKDPSIFPEREYRILHIFIDDGLRLIVSPVSVKEVSEGRFRLDFPTEVYSVGKRQTRRYPCKREIFVELSQGGLTANGQLLDFSPMGFRVRVLPEASPFLKWFNAHELVNVQLKLNRDIYLSSNCRCVRQMDESRERDIVVVPADHVIKRFKKRSIRNPRQRLVPSPTLVFEHPLLGKEVQIRILDISTSGLSAEESAKEGLLIPGMIIPKMEIEFAGGVRFSCSGQVLYRIKEESRVHSGIAILDIGINAYSKFSQILLSSLDPGAHISNKVDMDDLWEFFFETGFIYPTKYKLIHAHRNRFKHTYEKLYTGDSEIAKHIIYQKNGRICGHISMIRVYESAWMIHHHAARTNEGERTGFKVLKQMILYLNDMHRFPSAKMSHVICFFRPESRFPNRVFGDFTRELNAPRCCSMDLFGYLTHINASLVKRLPNGWFLRECTVLDLWKLNRSYRHRSGGLLLDVLQLDNEPQGNDSLSQTYGKLGLTREVKAYSLVHHEELCGVLIVERSDQGMNLSELLNNIKTFVLSGEEMSWEILSTAISQLASRYDMKEVSVLIYPMDYVEKKEIRLERQYYLWILSVACGDEYLEYMQKYIEMTSN